MAKNVANIHLTGWLNDVKHFQWGSALKVSVDVRKQNAQGQWETVDKTVYDCTTNEQVHLDGVKQVTVTGRIVGTQTFQKRDGSTGSAVKVRIESVVAAEAEAYPAQSPLAVWPDAKPIPDGNAPF